MTVSIKSIPYFHYYQQQQQPQEEQRVSREMQKKKIKWNVHVFVKTKQLMYHTLFRHSNLFFLYLLQ